MAVEFIVLPLPTPDVKAVPAQPGQPRGPAVTVSG